LELKETFQFFDFETVIGSVTNEYRVNRLFEAFKPQVVFHAAAYKHVPMMENNPTEAVFNNVLGTKLVADIAVKFHVEKFVMISTDKAVNPTNVMGASKRIAEIYTQTLNYTSQTKFITTRFGNVLGSNGSVIPRFKKQIENGGPITITHPDIIRYFMTIPEACQLVLEAGAMGQGGEIFIFDMGKPVKILDLAKKMIKLSGLTYGKDIQISFTGLRPGEKLYEELLNNKENTIPTYHPKIMIAKVNEYKQEEVMPKIMELLNTLPSHNNFRIVSIMKDIVPEFVSRNSIFEEIDQQKKYRNEQQSKTA
nr:polysaccharide biosynthesis protein [Tenuifilum sp.]